MTVLGAGGTAQATMAALLALGVPECVVLVRDPGRAERVLHTAQQLGVADHPGPARTGLAPRWAPTWWFRRCPAAPRDALAARSWTAGQAVLDVAYDPWPSALARAAAAGGAKVISGALMLLHQAGVQVELMTGLEAPVDDMRAALHEARPSAGVGPPAAWLG